MLQLFIIDTQPQDLLVISEILVIWPGAINRHKEKKTEISLMSLREKTGSVIMSTFSNIR